jgi:hypothetical protein
MTGSGLCENALPEALTTRDFGEVAVFGHLAMFWRPFCRERLLMRLQPSLSGSATGYGHLSDTQDVHDAREVPLAQSARCADF